MKTLSFFAFLFALTLTAQAKDTTKAAPYFDPKSFDYKSLVGQPPAVGSDATKKEIYYMLQRQATRNEADIKRMKQEASGLNMWLFESVMGKWYQKKTLPVTVALFDRVNATEHPIVEDGKTFFNRPRPSVQDPRIHPAVDVPTNASFPSGHSTVGNLDAMILAELAPDEKELILARGKQIGEDRVDAGVHFPSDVVAGYHLAAGIFKHLMADPGFLADLNKAKAEVLEARSQ